MEFKHGLISADSHVVTDRNAFLDRMSKSKFGERIPHIMEVENNGAKVERWVVNDRPLKTRGVCNCPAVMGDPSRLSYPQRWDDVPAKAYVPSERLKALDADGIDGEVLFPNDPSSFHQYSDPEFELACVQAYNDWLIEDWASASNRFVPQCIVPLWPPEAIVQEIRRAVANGHRGVIFPAVPMNLRKLPHINGPEYNAVWAVCQDLEVPLCFHAGSAPELRFPVYPALAPEVADALRAVIRPASAAFDLTNILFSRILLRFPKLNVVFAESTIGWGTFLLEYADHQYEQDQCNYEITPSEMFRRQCFLTTWYDSVEINARHIGASNILWSNNFPAANSTWPDSQTFAIKCLTGMSHDERDQILWANAARLYKIGRA
jgi:predicted TIM-barrel fold metal-dependent hydrolase